MKSHDPQNTGPGPLPVIAPRGEFDYETVPLLQAQIDAAVANHGGVILDATNITFTDSILLTMLLATHQRSRLRIANPSPRLAHLLSIYGVDQVLHIYPTLHAARTARNRPSPDSRRPDKHPVQGAAPHTAAHNRPPPRAITGATGTARSVSQRRERRFLDLRERETPALRSGRRRSPGGRTRPRAPRYGHAAGGPVPLLPHPGTTERDGRGRSATGCGGRWSSTPPLTSPVAVRGMYSVQSAARSVENQSLSR